MSARTFRVFRFETTVQEATMMAESAAEAIANVERFGAAWDTPDVVGVMIEAEDPEAPQDDQP